MRFSLSFVLSLSLCAVPEGCSPATDAPSSSARIAPFGALSECEVTDIEGREQQLYNPDTLGLLLVFTSHDCPIANAYAPRIKQIYEEYSARGIRCVLVHVDPRVSSEQLKTHGREYGLRMPILHDRAHEWVRRAKATVTPQAILWDKQGRTVYSGRIDDQYVDFGSKRREPTRHDLVDALEAFLSGRPVTAARTPAIGCYISDLWPVDTSGNPVDTSGNKVP